MPSRSPLGILDLPCRLYNKRNNWDKVKVEEQELEAAPRRQHHLQSAEDSMSNSFQTHDSDIDNVFELQNCYGNNMVQGQAMTPRNDIGVVTVKEDNDWFTDMNLDDLQASYNMAHTVNPNPAQTANLVAGQGHGYLQGYGYLQYMNSPSMKMWQTILPPF